MSRFFNPVQSRVLNELLRKLPEFARTYFEDGLTVEEYGPVEHFRHMFIDSWEKTLKRIREEGRTVA